MMGKPAKDSHFWHSIEFPKSFLTICIFILITAFEFEASQHSEADCSLTFQFPSTNGTSCQVGDWGGFLNRNCCVEAFDGYLYGLAKRANQTGKIYLNSTEQRNCLTLMMSFQKDVFGCGIEKLTTGAGGCSDFSMSDVKNILGDELGSLNEDCKLVTADKALEQSCPSCKRRWNDIKGTDSVATNVQTDLCRFAVLVGSTSSRIEDKAFVQGVHRCLGEPNILASEDDASKGKQKRKIATGIWILIGSLTGGVILMILIAACILFKRHFRSTPPEKELTALKGSLLNEPACPRVPIKTVYTATDNLNESNFIGEGTAGKVYKGIMSNNQHVAIKHIINDGNMETFVREVTSLSHVRHPNIVALLGCCVKEDECFLVYELCPNGSLSDWLFGKDNVLSWIQRLEIAIDSARGLWFLHTYPEGCIVHRDIKPTNILLGAKFEAKLSDFGLSKVIEVGEEYVSSEVRGTFGYVDPDYQSNHHVNSSGDVYSFGIVLLQILSGKRVINMNLRRPMPLSKMAKALTRGGSIGKFADPKLRGEYSEEALKFALQLALSCTALKQQRPSMEQVVTRLEQALHISTMIEDSTP
ncbi:Receptor-like protein kinase [Quillaja saponaria]|uniref:Receptor-like protein kinase n=1 Tax=Quillaja saponaria TaxID=32244 RepID=A0AAD7PXA8_QUISA|nr:Receptor-like protein kinase [Quillaja saponaria]